MNEVLTTYMRFGFGTTTALIGLYPSVDSRQWERPVPLRSVSDLLTEDVASVLLKEHLSLSPWWSGHLLICLIVITPVCFGRKENWVDVHSHPNCHVSLFQHSKPIREHLMSRRDLFWNMICSEPLPDRCTLLVTDSENNKTPKHTCRHSPVTW